MIKYLSNKIASQVAESDVTADQEIIAYGFEILLQEAGIVVIAALIALLFGLLPYVLAALVSYNLIRQFSGGAHSASRAVCMIFSVFLLYGISFLSARTGLSIPLAVVFLLYVFNVSLLLLYAPADTEIKPIQEPETRKKLKASAIASVTLCFLVAVLTKSRWEGISNVLLLIPTLATCTTHPIAYKLFGCEKSKMTTEVSQ